MYFVYTISAEFPLTKDNSLILYHTFSCEQLDFFIGTDPNPNPLITAENQVFCQVIKHWTNGCQNQFMSDKMVSLPDKHCPCTNCNKNYHSP